MEAETFGAKFDDLMEYISDSVGTTNYGFNFQHTVAVNHFQIVAHPTVSDAVSTQLIGLNQIAKQFSVGCLCSLCKFQKSKFKLENKDCLPLCRELG